MNFNLLGQALKKKKNEFLFHQGDIDQSMYYIEAGLLKATYVTPNGNEFIKSFLKEGDLIGSLSSCVLGAPSRFSLLCLEDSSIIEIPFSKLKTLTQENHNAALAVIDNLTHLLLKKEQREYEFLCLDAESRFNLMCEKSPDLLNRVKQQDLAKYLGIAPVSLSRIRSKSQKS